MAQPSPDRLNYRPVVTDEEAEEALHALIQSTDRIAQARARVVKADAMLKHVKAVAASLSAASSVQARENEALASKQYKTAIEELAEATFEFERAKSQRENNLAIIEAWRTASSNARAARI